MPLSSVFSALSRVRTVVGARYVSRWLPEELWLGFLIDRD
jgi:hypothetical protein